MRISLSFSRALRSMDSIIAIGELILQYSVDYCQVLEILGQDDMEMQGFGLCVGPALTSPRPHAFDRARLSKFAMTFLGEWDI
jgi:hypothetical protein